MADSAQDGPVYALNLFDVASGADYVEYARGAARAIGEYGGRVLARGELREAVVGDIAPRRVMLLVEWASRERLEQYRNDPGLRELHGYRERGVANFVWHLFDRLEDFRPLLKG